MLRVLVLTAVTAVFRSNYVTVAMTSAAQAVDFEVFGKVQGVFFRKYTKEQAEKLGLRGWCKNTSQGTVLGHMQGPTEKVETMNIIEAEILTGCGVGESRRKRVQFPVCVCFAMTINKSQGQTLTAAGVDLRTRCFSLGQLYVACSRVTSPESLYILTTEGKTNVVYREVLEYN